MSILSQYIQDIQREFDKGQSTEHSFRSALKTLLESLSPNVLALNESQRITGVGMPDFTIMDKKNNTINIGWIEAKDLYIDLDEKKNKDQLGRYLSAFDNFIYTNNLTFNFYRNGSLVESISLGEATKKELTWLPSQEVAENGEKLEHLLKDFLSYQGQTITSSEKLARAMAQKAQLIKYAIQKIFETDESESTLHTQYETFKSYLVHDLTVDSFADMYAQTIAYGLFTARLYDPTLPTFSRAEAETLIPKSTPFIRWLFKQMSNDDEFDDRIAHIVDDLVAIFLHCNVADLLKSYNAETGRDDPIIHFYETFLGEYDQAMRKKRGVYYTPEPVVKFIVRGVDYLLKSEFGLSMGLADTSKIEHTFTQQGKKIKKNIHRVQVLDPATGTGTFLDETVKYVHETYFAGQAGIWKQYVSNDLLPRIRGFEILMASYTMAHLKLGLTLGDTGWTGDDRFNIYLTNSLEEPHEITGSLFAAHLAKESEQASKIKKEQPIMVVMGNPPYAVSSTNKGERIQNLLKDYKKDLNEKKLNLDDDYVKFIRYAEHFIEKNNEGILAYITNNTYIDGVTFRQMRKKLLETFDTIYVVDLHGNSKKKEVCPDGSKDENVFDIMQGVSIIFGVKKTGSKKLGTIYHTDVWGKRESKYNQLQTQHIGSFQSPEKLKEKGEKVIKWKKLKKVEPYYFFVPKDFSAQKKYEEGVKVDELFKTFGSSLSTDRDALFINNSEKLLGSNMLQTLAGEYDANFAKTYRIEDSGSYKMLAKLQGKIFDDIYINKIQIKPFDYSYIYYDSSIISRPAKPITSQLINKDNYILLTSGQASKGFRHAFISKNLTSRNTLDQAASFGAGKCFPLYLYSTDLSGQQTRTDNLNQEMMQERSEKLQIQYAPIETIDQHSDEIDFSEELTARNAFDYIYAVLHSPTYRETYKEFLKIDFPRIPLTDKQEVFWKLVKLGKELRGLHLMESIEMGDLITTYPVEGDNMVGKIGKASFVENKVYINEAQYFESVPQVAREFYIGGYQPAQKRLKDRKGRELSYEDIIHYQKIIVALAETDRVMKEIDGVKFV